VLSVTTVQAVSTRLKYIGMQQARLNQQQQVALAALPEAAWSSCMQTSFLDRLKPNPALTMNADAVASKHASVMYNILRLSFILASSTRKRSNPMSQLQLVALFCHCTALALLPFVEMRRLKEVPEPLNNELGQSSSMDQAYNATEIVDENEEPPPTYTNPGGVVLPDALALGTCNYLSQQHSAHLQNVAHEKQ
jgi:hypothetical protein